MGYLRRALIGIGLAFLTTSTVRYWMREPEPPSVVYVHTEPKPQPTLEERLHQDVSSTLKVYYAK